MRRRRFGRCRRGCRGKHQLYRSAADLDWMQAIEHVELERFTLEKGLDDDNDSDESTGEDDLSYLIVVPAPVCVPNPR